MMFHYNISVPRGSDGAEMRLVLMEYLEMREGRLRPSGTAMLRGAATTALLTAVSPALAQDNVVAHRDAAARPQPMGHVSQRRSGGEGGADRPCRCLARHLDGMARQDDRDRGRQAAGARGLEDARERALHCRRASERLADAEGEARQFLACRADGAEAFRRLAANATASRSASRRGSSGSKRPTDGGSCAAPASSPPSARPRPSSACSARSGAS